MKVGDLVKFVPFEWHDGFNDKKDRGIGIIAETHLLNDYTGATQYLVRWTNWSDDTKWHWIRESYLEVIG
jgi:hypothetical protein